jgi:hypothetical protein
MQGNEFMGGFCGRLGPCFLESGAGNMGAIAVSSGLIPLIVSINDRRKVKKLKGIDPVLFGSEV